jgi:nucleotide-binding universal stress UspA family protein
MKARTILVGYDDTAAARHALDRAVELASPGGRLVVLTVAEMLLSPDIPVTDEFLDPVPVLLESAEPPDVEAALGRARDLLAGTGIDADFVWVTGEPAGAIVDVARDRGADLIVIGAHHDSLLERLFKAGVENEVRRSAPCEVLVVP